MKLVYEKSSPGRRSSVIPRTEGLPAADLVGAAERAAVDLARDLHPDLPAGVPGDLLLLPQGLLPVVLAVAARVRGGRATRQVQR